MCGERCLGVSGFVGLSAKILNREAVCIRWTRLWSGLGTGLTESCAHHFEASKATRILT